MRSKKTVKLGVWILLIGILLLGCSDHETVSQQKYQIKINKNGEGEVKKKPAKEIYKAGSKVELTAQPESGWKFKQWSGNLEGKQPTQTVTVDNELIVEADFVDVPSIGNLEISKSQKKKEQVAVNCKVTDKKKKVKKVKIDWGDGSDPAVTTSNFKQISRTHAYENAGSYTIKITATNEAGHTKLRKETVEIEGPLGISFVNDKVNDGEVEVAEGNKLTLQVDKSAFEADQVELNLADKPEGASFNSKTGEFVWTPDYNQEGTHTVTFAAAANDKTISRSVDIIVNNTDRAPTIEEIGDKTVKVGEELNFMVAANDQDGDEVNLSVGEMPSGANFENKRFSWKPGNEQIETYDIMFTAEANGKADTEKMTITVQNRKFDVKVKTGSKFKGKYRVKLYQLDSNAKEIKFYTKTMGGLGDKEIKLKPITNQQSEQVCQNGGILKVDDVDYQKRYVFDYDIDEDFSGGDDSVNLPSNVSQNHMDTKIFTDSEGSTAEIDFENLDYGHYYIKVDKKGKETYTANLFDPTNLADDPVLIASNINNGVIDKVKVGEGYGSYTDNSSLPAAKIYEKNGSLDQMMTLNLGETYDVNISVNGDIYTHLLNTKDAGGGAKVKFEIIENQWK